MIVRIRLLAPLVLALGCGSAALVCADGMRVLEADARSVLLEIQAPEFLPSAGAAVQRLPSAGFQQTSIQARPLLPFASTLLAVPPGARVTAAFVEDSGERAFEGVNLAVVPRQVFRESPETGDLQPYPEDTEATRDGVWPPSAIELSAPFTVRRQSLVAIHVYPYRWDAGERRLLARRSMKVRVRFEGAAVTRGLGAERNDRHWDPVWDRLIANPAEARRWRTSPRSLAARPALGQRIPGASPLALTAFDEDAPEVRVKLDSSAVYTLDYDALAANGYPAGVPIAEVSVHRHEFMDGQLVPYSTIELPVELDDFNTNGVFDTGDRILVWTLNWAQRAGASFPQRLWGDAEQVFVTRLAGGTGLRMSARTGWRGAAGLIPPPSYPVTYHYERDFTVDNAGSAPADTNHDAYQWTAQTLYYTRPETLQFEANQLDPTHSVTINLTWNGRSSGSHWIWAQVKNASAVYTSVVDSVSWFGRGAITSGATLPGSAISEGRTNRLRTWGKQFTAPPDPSTNNAANAALNYFEVSYWRAFAALSGYLECNNAQVDGEFELLGTAFTDAATVRAYDVTNPLDPVRLTGIQVQPNGGTFDVRLQDSTGVGEARRYVMFDQPKIPPPAAFSAVQRAQLSDFTEGDYLLIGPSAFLTVAEPLAQHREGQNLSVVRAPIQAVWDEFNGGRPSAYGLKRFIKYAYDRWNAAFVCLLGDGSMDPQRHERTSSLDWVSTQRIMGPVLASGATGSFFEAIPSDGWLAWCLDCTQPSVSPRLPDVHLGRIPVNSTTQLAGVVDKLVAYESSSSEAWRRNLVLASDDAYSSLSTFGGGAGTVTYCRKNYEDVFRQLNESVRRMVVDSAGLALSNVEVFNISYYLPNNPSDISPCAQVPDTCRCSLPNTQSRARLTALPELVQRLNAGRLWWSYQGHANAYVLAHEEFWRSNGPARGSDFNLLLNDGKPFFFSGFSCHPNAFAYEGENNPVRVGPSIGEMLVNLGNRRGAIGSWASTGFEVLPGNGTTHLNVTLARTMFMEPPRDPYLGEAGARTVLGEILSQTLIRNWEFTNTNESEGNVGISYCLLGDPATHLSIGAAQDFVTANTQPVTSGQVVRLRIGRDTLKVEADVRAATRLDSLSITRIGPGAAVVTIPPADYTVTPAFPDTAFASFGGRRYHVSYRDTLLADTYRYVLRTVDRDGIASPFEIPLAFETVLRSSGSTVNDLDALPPNAVLTMLVLSPKPLDLPVDLELRIGGVIQPFTFVAASGDTSGREWILSWNHGPYPFGENVVELRAANGATRVHRFVVNLIGAELRIQNPLVFPNPFEDDLGARFSFTLESASPADVLIRVYTVTGRLVYERKALGLAPTYQQLEWDGRDAEGSILANGVYLYRIFATNSASKALYEGRLVKLRKPRRVADDTTTP